MSFFVKQKVERPSFPTLFADLDLTGVRARLTSQLHDDSLQLEDLKFENKTANPQYTAFIVGSQSDPVLV